MSQDKRSIGAEQPQKEHTLTDMFIKFARGCGGRHAPHAARGWGDRRPPKPPLQPIVPCIPVVSGGPQKPKQVNRKALQLPTPSTWPQYRKRALLPGALGDKMQAKTQGLRSA